MMWKIIFQMLKLSNTLSPIETLVKKTKYTEENQKKKAIKILTNKTRKEISDDQQDNFSDAESIQYAELYRDSSKKKRNIQKKS